MGQFDDERIGGRKVKVSEVSVRDEATMTEATEQERFGSNFDTRRKSYRGRYRSQHHGGYRGISPRNRWNCRDQRDDEAGYSLSPDRGSSEYSPNGLVGGDHRNIHPVPHPDKKN